MRKLIFQIFMRPLEALEEATGNLRVAVEPSGDHGPRQHALIKRFLTSITRRDARAGGITREAHADHELPLRFEDIIEATDDRMLDVGVQWRA